MNSFDPQKQESFWQERRATSMEESLKHYKATNMAPPSNPRTMRPGFSGGFDDDLVAAVVPSVTVVLEGRSICQRISLHKHGSYQSLARALRQMFVDMADSSNETNLDLSNAIPGYLIAYEDMENDLLLVGDLNWKDFVRVAKRIRILPVKAKSRKQNKE
ncbi:Auxin-responsive protein iaa33 [Salvia divinorum]|uniref:Auxin-responsive protein n=1 Tax=Salvia divinorum TaxID=28513 RepID=A0ABD1FTB0_SALDI